MAGTSRKKTGLLSRGTGQSRPRSPIGTGHSNDVKARGPIGLHLIPPPLPARSDLRTRMRVGNLTIEVFHPASDRRRPGNSPIFRIVGDAIKSSSNKDSIKIKEGNYVFPIATPFWFRDTWHAPRSGG
jgi:hypothetical protein